MTLHPQQLQQIIMFEGSSINRNNNKDYDDVDDKRKPPPKKEDTNFLTARLKKISIVK